MSSLFIPKQFLPTSMMDDAKLVQEFLDKHPRLDPRRCSRFSEMARAVLKGKDNQILPTRPDFRTILQANRDLLEFAYIHRMLSPDPKKKELWERIGKLFSDAMLPSKSATRSDSRNVQFELLCEAMLVRAGFEPVYVSSDGPDFRCTLMNRTLVVEAKMVRSLDALEGSLATASKQIQRAGEPGLIFLDWTFAMNSEGTARDHILAYKKSVSNVSEAQDARYMRIRREHLIKFESGLAAKRVLGVVYVDRLIFQDGKDPATGMGRWCLATFRDQQPILPRMHIGDGKLLNTAFELLSSLSLPAPNEHPAA